MLLIVLAKRKIFLKIALNNVTFPQGDSGGPLIYYRRQQPIQIGVLEFSSVICGINHTDFPVFISVSYFRAWIDSILLLP